MNILKGRKFNLLTVGIVVLVILNLIGIALLKRNQQELPTLAVSSLSKDNLNKEGVDLNLLDQADKIGQAFPNEQEVIQLVTKINRYKNNFAKFSFNFDSDELKADGHQYLPLTIQVSGSNEKIAELIIGLLDSPLAFKVTSLEIINQEAASKETEMVLKANLYVSEAFESK
jgi:hypothetical protein